MSSFKLSQAEQQSALWLKLKEHALKRLEQLRVQNENNLDATETAKLRGRIAEIKSFLKLDTPASEIASNAGDEPPFDEW
jgi:hypothetical protein